MNAASKNKAVFLDRDGVVCEALPRGDYLVSWEQFKLLPGIVEFVAHAKRNGFLVFVVTNQGQIAKGLVDTATVLDINQRMEDLFSGALDKTYMCPHHNTDNCECRKPKPGMLTQAAREFGVDPAQSYIIGDSDKDVLAGAAFGCKTIFLKNEHNAHELARVTPNFVIADLAEAARIIV